MSIFGKYCVKQILRQLLIKNKIVHHLKFRIDLMRHVFVDSRFIFSHEQLNNLKTKFLTNQFFVLSRFFTLLVGGYDLLFFIASAIEFQNKKAQGIFRPISFTTNCFSFDFPLLDLNLISDNAQLCYRIAKGYR